MRRTHELRATPRAASRPPVWLLGSSDYSARLAAGRGLPYVFAHHFSGSGTAEALELYRSGFRPSPEQAEPQTFLTVNVSVAETAEEAHRLALPQLHAMVALRTGAPLRAQLTVEEAEAVALPEDHARLLDGMRRRWVIGTPDEAAAEIARARGDVRRGRGDGAPGGRRVRRRAGRGRPARARTRSRSWPARACMLECMHPPEDLLATLAPGHPGRVEALGEGWDNVVWAVGDDLVLRVVKDPDPAVKRATVERDVALLAFAGRHSTLPPPRVVAADPGAGALLTTRVPGVAAVDAGRLDTHRAGRRPGGLPVHAARRRPAGGGRGGPSRPRPGRGLAGAGGGGVRRGGRRRRRRPARSRSRRS